MILFPRNEFRIVSDVDKEENSFYTQPSLPAMKNAPLSLINSGRLPSSELSLTAGFVDRQRLYRLRKASLNIFAR